MKRLNLEGVYQIKQDIEKKILNNFITNVVVINSHDLLLSFSFYGEEKLLISLNHQNPFLGFVSKEVTAHTVLGSLNDNLRKYLKGSYITEVDVLNNDRVLKFTLHKSDEFYEQQTNYLILELIPTISNLIYLNDRNEIIFAKHYSDLSASRPIIHKMTYSPLSKSKELERGEFNYKEYSQEVEKYVHDSLALKQKEKALPLFNFFKNKIKSLNKKIKVLENEIEEAKRKLVYKEYGEYLLTFKNEEELLNPYINNIKDIYADDLSVEENASKMFERYKKSKRTIENDLREIEIAKSQIQEYTHYLDVFEYLSEEELNELEHKYLAQANSKKKAKVVISSNEPYYIEVNHIRIGFGKNKEQNNNLTFKKANKEHTFIHLADYSASHVVIFSSEVSNDILLIALEIALILSGRNDGELQVAKIKDIKKGQSLGQVLLNKYTSYTLREVRDSTKSLLKNQKRF